MAQMQMTSEFEVRIGMGDLSEIRCLVAQIFHTFKAPQPMQEFPLSLLQGKLAVIEVEEDVCLSGGNFSALFKGVFQRGMLSPADGK